MGTREVFKTLPSQQNGAYQKTETGRERGDDEWVTTTNQPVRQEGTMAAGQPSLMAAGVSRAGKYIGVNEFTVPEEDSGWIYAYYQAPFVLGSHYNGYPVKILLAFLTS